MNDEIKKMLSNEAAAKVHQDWCKQEIKGFLTRLVEARKVQEKKLADERERDKDLNKQKPKNNAELIDNDGNIRKKQNLELENYKDIKYLVDLLKEASFKNGKQRNVVELGKDILKNPDMILKLSLFVVKLNDNITDEDIDEFMKFMDDKVITVKRFTKRKLTKEEIERSGSENYVEGEENILRSFESLSEESKKENLEAAKGAANVFDDLINQGISIDQMEHDVKLRKIIGKAIHADWLKRNLDHPNKSLLVPYEELDDWTKQQDLTVFDALLDVVKKYPKITQKEIDYDKLNNKYAEEELQILNRKVM